MKIVEGLQFFENNKKKEGVIVLPSGVQYEILSAGTGEKPKSDDEVTVHYKGTLVPTFTSGMIDGKRILTKTPTHLKPSHLRISKIEIYEINENNRQAQAIG